MGHSSNQSHFATIPRAEIPRSKFKRDHNLHTTINAGDLVPVFLDEVVPADTFIMKEHMFGRLATLLRPLMDNMYLDTFYFFCPTRLLQDNFVKMMGEKRNPSDSTDYAIAQLTIPANTANLTLVDYFGLPTKVANSYTVSALPFRMYNLIWNEWFRDQNLQNSLNTPVNDGPDTFADYTIQKRGKRHDYFTSCLPFPQKGPAVTLPLGLTAPVKSDNTVPMFHGAAIDKNIQFTNGQGAVFWSSTATTTEAVKFGTVANPAATGLMADLSTATASTINAIREAFQIQRLYERDARGGTRYTELIRSHFGVISPDARLQRPEYLGGSSTRLGVSPVANTAGPNGTSTAKQADLAGIGTVSVGGKGFTYSATEHGYILGLASLRADLNYQQGLNKLWRRDTRFDFYWPAFSHLGEQAVLNEEIYLQGTAADSQTFGYQERFAEMKYKPNAITGRFRSNDSASLDSWHLSQYFGALPVLNSSFITEAPPVSRVIAVTTEPHLILDCYFDLDCVRPLPMYSVPGMMDHF